MLCLSLGDSLAVGVGQQLPQCRTEAEVGITSTRYLTEHRLPHAADRVVISLGVNDVAGTNTLQNLSRLRSTVSARSVIWLLPFGHADIRAAVQAVARRYGDRTIDTSPFVSADKLHPNEDGYRALDQLAMAPPAPLFRTAPFPVVPMAPNLGGTHSLFRSIGSWPGARF
jgi:lysophospholipase L1-like esterase